MVTCGNDSILHKIIEVKYTIKINIACFYFTFSVASSKL